MPKEARQASGDDAPKTHTTAQLAADIGIGAFGSIARAEALSNLLYRNHIRAVREELQKEPIDDAFTLLMLVSLERDRGVSLAEKVAAESRKRHLSASGKKGAEALHNKPGGAREKVAKIRTRWASGLYKSRDECAEQECADIPMSFSSARKALINTPDPSPWPAKS